MKLKIISLVVVGIVFGGMFYIFTSPYRMERVEAWLNGVEQVEHR